MNSAFKGSVLDAVANGNDGFHVRFTRLAGERFKSATGETETAKENVVIVQWQPSQTRRDDSDYYAEVFPLTREGLQSSLDALNNRLMTLKLSPVC